MTASGSIDAAVEAATAVIPVDPDDGTCIVAYQPDGIPLWGTPQSLANVIVHAAAPVLLAAERDRIAEAIAAEGTSLVTELLDLTLKTEWRDGVEYGLREGYKAAAAIARGSVAGKPDTQGGHGE